MNRLHSIFGLLALVTLTGVAPGQRSRTTDATINTVPLAMRSEKPYLLHCELQPKEEIVVRSPMSGFVREVSAKLGDQVRSRSPLVRLDSELHQIAVDRAAASLALARGQLDALKAQSAAPTEIARAEADAKIAEANKREADYWIKQTGIVSPFDGQVIEIHAQQGQYVTQGQTLMKISNYKTLVVWMPWDSTRARRGAKQNVKIEGETYTGTVTAVVPVIAGHRRLVALRGRLSTVVIELSNSQDKLRPGQRVACNLVPRGPIATVPEDFVKRNGTVQILRGDVVRDIEVRKHAIPYKGHIDVSGPFKAGDALITSTSRTVRDGTRVAPDKVRRSS